MSKVLQIWLIAAPPEVKFATIACVTDGGNADTPWATTPWLPAKTATSGFKTCGRAEACQPAMKAEISSSRPSDPAGLVSCRLPLARRGGRRLVRPRHLQEEGADVVEGAAGGVHGGLATVGGAPIGESRVEGKGGRASPRAAAPIPPPRAGRHSG